MVFCTKNIEYFMDSHKHNTDYYYRYYSQYDTNIVYITEYMVANAILI